MRFSKKTLIILLFIVVAIAYIISDGIVSENEQTAIKLFAEQIGVNDQSMVEIIKKINFTN